MSIDYIKKNPRPERIINEKDSVLFQDLTMGKKTKKYVRVPSHTKKVGGKKVTVRSHIRKVTKKKK